MITPHKLTLVPYLQRWDHRSRNLSIRLLIAPTGNPLEPLGSAVPQDPAFADAGLAFAVHISDSIDALPQRTLVDQITVLPDPAGVTPTLTHPHARPIFTAIKQVLEIPDGPAADTFAPQDRDQSKQLRKYLPRSYRQSFPFVRPRTSLAVIDNSYHCLMKCPPDPPPPSTPRIIGWGEAIAFALRRPRLAEALGLIADLEIPLDAAPRLVRGGWLWVELADGGDFAARAATTPTFLRAFATRVPALLVDRARQLFTPVVIPVSDDAAAAGALGNFDKVMIEANRFDDGFAKIVHARQPIGADHLDEDGSGPPPIRDEGIHLAWDDEDVLEGQNRALGAPPDGEDPVLAPRGVRGYRVDVRPQGSQAWTSLSTVQAPLAVGVDLGVAVEQRWAEVVPTEHSGQLWLPAWFLKWRGRSLVMSTADDRRLMNAPPGQPDSAVPVGADAVEPRYGRRYEFRVRMADATGGGPAVTSAPERPGDAPIAVVHMKRHRTPTAVELDTVTPEPDGTVRALRIRRPRIGYPEAVFAAGAAVRPRLLAQIAANDSAPPGTAIAPTIEDPDTVYLRIRVLLRTPRFDPQADADGFVEWYRTTRRFPDDAAQPIDLVLDWRHAADYRGLDISPQLGAEGNPTGPLTLVTSRDIRVEVRALGRNDMNYFGSEQARYGTAQLIDLHAVAPAIAEADALRPLASSSELRSVFLRSDPPVDRMGFGAVVNGVAPQSEPTGALLGRLAGALDLSADGPLVTGPPGERILFGCAGLTHHLAPDLSSIEFTHPAELAGQWINAIQVVIDRDWTWRGAGSPSLVVTRTVGLPDAVGAVSETVDVGVIEMMDAINTQSGKRPNRAHTRMIFLDALPPRLGPDGFPHEMEVTYRAFLRFEGGEGVARAVTSRLPIVAPPRQIPRVVAAGIALTPYERDADYAATSSRIKRLWVEFAEAPADPRDAYFVRPLTSTPDPMLLPGTEPVANPVEITGTPLDPELVRVVTPGQVQDLSGLSTMQRLEPSKTSVRHYLVPLPPNVDPGSPELFSFYTYEIRVGHDRGPADNPLWSTAQGRFGESLVLDGVQHPAPELPCSVIAEPDGAIRVRAPYALPYRGLHRVQPTTPNTVIWIVLYARVTQADGGTKRNIQIDLHQLRPLRTQMQSIPLFAEGEASWSAAEVADALKRVGIPYDSPLSVLAVELLPEPNGTYADPLGGDLGAVRIVRTSPLSPLNRGCCVPAP
ncbi:hypothetical protein H0264_23670 [Nocardia huaxiensis]|uniref:Uncharacterized protein n=1 Tax=Nocardia huaxiensis TaxID=2755382 RepID=A0A7D6Z707_9NOCA|nr:hypothetical protein [Nocardia huaxiensis]QLY28368.1 hypothetical protein H0264_23670 [Nocardia huaxiensis]